jgi:hypothetical protein
MNHDWQTIADIIDWNWSPWIGDVNDNMLGGVTLVNHSRWDGHGDQYDDFMNDKVTTTVLSGDDLATAFDSVQDLLCCVGIISADGIDFGCAEDADQILQQAVYGRGMWG